MKFRIEPKNISPALGAAVGAEKEQGVDIPPIWRNMAQEFLERVFRLETLQRSQFEVV
jgi:hypothetical protein